LLNQPQSTTLWNHQNHKQNFEIAKHNEELRFRARIWDNIRHIWEWWWGRIWKRRQWKWRALQSVVGWNCYCVASFLTEDEIVTMFCVFEFVDVLPRNC
jgi:hypothetical protein